MKLKVVLPLILVIANFVYAASPQSSVTPSAGVAGRRSPLQVGEMAPDFMLEDQQGRKVTLSTAQGELPAVLVFYRGYW
ncbi:MAG: redoxin domain-containing protein [Pyrinomonadaceae bacterium]|nr:redoxin domain-containing protein [Pyrinomonadaceae bacterium]